MTIITELSIEELDLVSGGDGGSISSSGGRADGPLMGSGTRYDEGPMLGSGNKYDGPTLGSGN